MRKNFLLMNVYIKTFFSYGTTFVCREDSHCFFPL